MVTSPLFWGSELFCGVTQNGWWWIRVQLGLTAPPPPLDGDSLKLTPWCCHKHWRAFSAHLLSTPSIQRDRSSCPQLLCLPLDSIFLCHTVLGWTFLGLRLTFNRQRRCDRPFPIRKMTIKRQRLAGKERRRRSHSYNTVLDC